MYSLTGLEAGSTKSLSLGWNQGASKAVLPPKSLGENPFLASSSFWWPLGFLSLWLHHCNLYLCGHVVSFSSVCSQNFLCLSLRRTLLIAVRAHLDCCHCSATQSCPALWDPTDYSTPGFPALHHCPQLAQTQVHRVGDAIQPSHPLSPG